MHVGVEMCFVPVSMNGRYGQFDVFYDRVVVSREPSTAASLTRVVEAAK